MVVSGKVGVLLLLLFFFFFALMCIAFLVKKILEEMKEWCKIFLGLILSSINIKLEQFFMFCEHVVCLIKIAFGCIRTGLKD